MSTKKMFFYKAKSYNLGEFHEKNGITKNMTKK